MWQAGVSLRVVSTRMKDDKRGMIDCFHGAKAAVFIGSRMLVYQRDRAVRWPGYWDFPGGGRAGSEDPFSCLAREVREEFGLNVSREHIHSKARVVSMIDPAQIAWFYVLFLPSGTEMQVRFGDEGQRWALMAPEDVANMPNLVPALQARRPLWLQDRGRMPI